MSTMPKGPPPSGGNIDLGPRVMAMFLTLSIFAFIVVVFRLVVRRKDHNLGMEDLFAFIAAAVFIGLAAVASYEAVHGTYQPAYYLTESQLELSLLMNTIGDCLTSIAAASMKISISLMLLRLMGRTAHWRKWFLWTLMFLTAVITIVTVFITFFQCRIPSAIWDLPLQAKTTCWSPTVLVDEAIFASAWYAFVDFVLALFPLLIIYNLHMSWTKKVALSVLLGLGVVTGIIASLKASLIPALASGSSGSFDEFNLQVFVGIEIFSLIVLGCVPVFKRPGELIFKRVYNNSLVTSIRRLVSGGSHADYTPNATVNKHGYTTHDDAEYALQNTAGVNFSHIKARDGSSSPEQECPEGALYPGKISGDGPERNGIQVTNSFHVV